MREMTTTNLYDRLHAIEDELLAIQRAVPFGQKPDTHIIGMIHISLAADLPGLISRAGKNKLTSEGYQLTLKSLDAFEESLQDVDFDGTARGSEYRALASRTRDLFNDLLAEYKRSGIDSIQ